MPSTDLLVQFARVATEARERDVILPLLTRAAVDHVGADAALVAEVVGDRIQIVAECGLTKTLLGWSSDADTIGRELGEEIVSATGAEFATSTVRVMTSTGDLFGALVLLYHDEASNSPQSANLADGLADLAAIALSRVVRYEELRVALAQLKTSQDLLVRTEKLRALGQMAAGITHDLKNILSPVSMHLQLLDMLLGKGEIAESKETVGEMKLIVRRGVETIERLRQFSQKAPEAKMEMLDLNRLVHEAIAISKPRMSSRGGTLSYLREELGELPLIEGKSSEIVGALVNLIVNAIDALPEGGNITLRTRSANGGAEVDVADDGPGMPPEVEHRVFEPFFTTKGESGTGLGLAMVYGCMQRHGGTVSLTTASGEGTTFTLFFPIAPEPA